MEIINRKVKDLVPYERNPRRNDMAVDVLAESIKEFGFRNPIIITKDGLIIAGHTRLKAAMKLGLKEVPCAVVSGLSDEQIKAFRLVENKTQELAAWDNDLLNTELFELRGSIDMNLFGFEDKVKEETTSRGTGDGNQCVFCPRCKAVVKEQ